MKNVKRILSLILVLGMLIPFCVIGVNADVSKALDTAEVSTNFLGWQDTAEAYPSVGNYSLSAALPLTNQGSAALRVRGTASSWANVQVVSPEVMKADCTDGTYTIHFSMKLESSDEQAIFGFRFGSEDTSSATGDWTVVQYTNWFQNKSYTPNAAADGLALTVGTTYAMDITVDSQAGKVTVSNGVGTTTNNDAHAVLGGLWLVAGGSSAQVAVIDDLVVKDSSGAAIYTQDFETLSKQPSPGTVLYEENFGGLLKKSFGMDGLGWKNITSGELKSGHYSVSLIESDFTGSASNAVRIQSSGSGYNSGMQIVSADTINALCESGEYSISCNIQFEQHSTSWQHYGFGFGFGSESGNPSNKTDGNWAGYYGNGYTLNNPWNTGLGSCTADAHAKNLALEIRVNSTTGKYQVYANGTLKKEFSGNGGLGGIWMYVAGPKAGSGIQSSVLLDNLVIKDTVSNTVIYQEDFGEFYLADDDVSSSLKANYFEQSTNTYLDTVATTAGVVAQNNSTRLKIVGKSGWASNENSAYKLVPACAIDGVLRYTINYTVHVEQASGAYSHGAFLKFGTVADDAYTGNILVLRSGDGMDALGFTGLWGYPNSYTQTTGTLMNRDLKISVAVDTVAKIANVYVNGECVIENVALSYVEAGDIYFGVRCNTTAYFDDILVTAGGFADTEADYIGLQKTALVDGKSSIRFAGVIGAAHELSAYRAVGFKITADYEGTATTAGGTMAFNQPCDTVYDKLIGIKISEGVSIPTEYLASDFGGRYIFATTISNIPASVGVVTFTLTPYFTLKDGSHAEGSTWTIVYDAATGTLLSQSLSYEYIMTIPTLSGSTRVDVSGDHPMMYKTETTLEEIQSYGAQLQTMGLSLYQTTQLGNTTTYVYASGDTTVTCIYDGNAATARVTIDRIGSRAQSAYENAGWKEITSPTFTQLQLNNLVSGSDGGMGYVLRLSDGRFVVIDGGSRDHDDHIRLYNVMKSQMANKGEPVIAAWFITHAHEDHYGNMLAFVNKYRHLVKIEQVVYNFAQDSTLKGAASTAILEAQIQDAAEKVVYARTGQSFHLADAVIDVIFTADDCYPYLSEIEDLTFNEVCMVLKINVADQSILLLADVEENEAGLICDRYSGTDVLSSNMVQQAHHGFWGASTALYEAIDADVVFWPAPTSWYYDLYDGSHVANTNLYSTNNADEVILAGNGTRTISLPYTPTASKPQNETYENYIGANSVIYSRDFSDICHVYESGFWCIGTNVHSEFPLMGHTQSNGTEYNYPGHVYMGSSNGDQGVGIYAKSSTQIGVIRPEYIRNSEHYQIVLDLTILAEGEGVSFWLQDSDPQDDKNRIYHTITEQVDTGDFTFVIDVQVNGSSVVYKITDGRGTTYASATVKNSSSLFNSVTYTNYGCFSLYLGAGAEVLVRGIELTKV